MSEGLPMVKDFNTVLLLDTYAGLLTEKQRRLCDMYYNQDFSLAEIAEIENTTRQAAMDGIGKARSRLKALEKSLGLSHRRQRTLEILERARSGQVQMDEMISELSDIWEQQNGV
ncbi:MAG: DNA-binding protein [Christensenellales bacterium]